MLHHDNKIVVGQREYPNRTGPGVALDSLGREGWELVAVTMLPIDATHGWTDYSFKRPLQQ